MNVGSFQHFRYTFKAITYKQVSYRWKQWNNRFLFHPGAAIAKIAKAFFFRIDTSIHIILSPLLNVMVMGTQRLTAIFADTIRGGALTCHPFFLWKSIYF